MKNSDISKMSSAELRKELGGAREKLREFHTGMTGSRVKNVKEGRTLRKTIARILTASRNGK
jgi:ribosomal protein L29